ncbi:MAG: hydantoinase B/oxoprolinase family protein [Proteobacteria bacterium]|nr:hydantoinase B/oxoprolinase family protein [Pseudomonadota bacterium]MBI3500064.1 hydantoinase B/oxoprolinase family protein [Pseudomonadota bacterium]
MTKPAPQLDPIGLEILSNGLRSIADECFIALMKSAYSTNIKERNDHSTALVDARGRLVVQAENSLAIHLGSMLGLMTAVLAKTPVADMRPGDIFVGNDPFVAGGTHLPDINLAMPVFIDGELLCFVCNIAHHADIGGMSPGSMAGGMTEIYQEGLRVPPIRLFRGGELVEDVLDLLLLNARVPQERRGDYFAQVASCRLGARRVAELAASQGRATLIAAFDGIIERTQSRMLAGIAQIPPGSYHFADIMDDDGIDTTNIPIRLRIDVGAKELQGRIRFDFEGTAPQVQGNINCTINATQAAVLYTLKCLLDPDVPNNHGLMQVVEIAAPQSSIVNAAFPAAVAARCNTAQRIVDVIVGALAPVMPNAAVGAANGANTTAVFFGKDPRTGQDYVYLETLGGGFGGRATKDGKDGVQVHMTNTSNLPVEAIEMEYPLLVEGYGLVDDSGGAGCHRGGMGLRRVVRPVGHTAIFSGQGERFVNRPWGVFGGGPGATGRFLLRDGKGTETMLSTKPSSVALTPDAAVVIETPGAGGYGKPAERAPADLAEDYRSGKFSQAYMREKYGFDPTSAKAAE